MKILAIETSCDETAVAILEGEGDERIARFRILGNALLSQIKMHEEFGGVVPSLAKREHAKNLIPLLEAALADAELLVEETQTISEGLPEQTAELLAREPELSEAFLSSVGEMARPDIDAIAVTAGPGLEPALWVGINFAKALALVWDLPIVAVNHMEGHTLSALARTEGEDLIMEGYELPILALLISGGHTELVAMQEWLSYKLLGQTRDDAVGEAFDKVARMMDLPYPGGPEIDRLAARDEEDEASNPFRLPRPMLDTDDCDFSFSGLKTAVLYLIKERGTLTEPEKEQLAREFTDAVIEVLWKKTARALDESGARTLVLGGGVSNNRHIRAAFTKNMQEKYSDASLYLPPAELTTDNAVMIGLAGFYHALRKEFADPRAIRANGNLSLA